MSDVLIDSLEAYMASLRKGPEAALEQLADKHDPESLRRRMVILLNSGRAAEAADLARTYPPAAVSCDVAVRALVRSGDHDTARQMVHWADNNADRPATWRAALFFAQERLTPMRADAAGAEPMNLYGAGETAADDALEILRPMVSAIGTRIENELQSQILQTALHAAVLRGQTVGANRLVDILENRKPLSLLVAQLAVDKRIRTVADLSNRLGREHDSFEARCLAALAEAKLEGRHEAALAAAQKLVTTSLTEPQRETLSRLLIDLANGTGDQQLQRDADRQARELSGRLGRLQDAERLLRRGAHEEARKLLDADRDESDALWLQLSAHAHLQAGDSRTGLALLQKVTALLPDPDLLTMAAGIAHQHEAREDAARFLDQLIAIRPTDRLPRRNRAALYVETQEYRRAANEYRHLVEAGVAEASDILNFSWLLVRIGELEEALTAVERLCTDPQPLLEAILAKCEVLLVQGRASDAFVWLRSYREPHWSTPAFVQRFLDVAFRSGNESEGHEALLRLRDLQREGRATANVLQEFTLDKVVQTLEKRRRFADDLHKKTIEGHAPWLMVDFTSGNAAYFGWRLRTQAVDWIYDEPINRARLCVYATNGLTPQPPSDEGSHLVDIECSPRGEPVVADLSALLTLHRLDLLNAAADFFGTIFVPAAYLASAISDADRLNTHQPSRRDAALLVRRAIDEGKVAVSDAETSIVVEEYESKTPYSRYRIRDVMQPLYEAGRINDELYRQVIAVAHHPARTDENHPALAIGAPIAVDLLTLTTIAQSGALTALLDGFTVRMTSTNHQELLSELRGFNVLEEVRHWNDDLWHIIRSDRRFQETPYVVPSEWKEHTDRAVIAVPLAGVALARHVRRPLLADDRVCQTIILNERRGNPAAAFGSDRLCYELAEQGLIDSAAVADAVLRLVTWRYRFLVVPPNVLKTFADRFRQYPPGGDLRRIAAYVHDCVRDPGLFAGNEAVDPPVSMGTTFFLRWHGAVIEFLMDVWADEQWAETQALALTRWVIATLLPSLPPATGREPASTRATGRLAIGRGLVRASHGKAVERSQKGLEAIADELGISKSEYLGIVGEVLNAL